MGLKVNYKRNEYEAKLTSFRRALYELAELHAMTEFDLNLVMSELINKSLQNKVKNKVGKMYQ